MDDRFVVANGGEYYVTGVEWSNEEIFVTDGVIGSKWDQPKIDITVY